MITRKKREEGICKVCGASTSAWARFELCRSCVQKHNPYRGVTPVKPVIHGNSGNRNANSIPIAQLDFEGKLIAEYPSLAKAALEVLGESATIRRAIQADRSAYGFRWALANHSHN